MKARQVIVLCAAATALAGCAGKEKKLAASFAPARLAPDASFPQPASVPVIEIPVPLPLPGQLLPVLSRGEARDRKPPTARVESANRRALHEPSSDGYVNAVQVYPWAEGAVYRLYAAPEQVSDITLQPGEGLIAVAAGDTVRWIIGDTVSGSGAARRTHVLVKPSAAGLKTNLVITTDRRSYHLQLESTRATAMAAVSWSYPQDQLIALQRSGAIAAATDNGGGEGERLHHRYTISGDRPPWRPRRAYDDGRQVFIEFPEQLQQGEAPPLFVLGSDGGAELVNYRIRGNRYIVDKLFTAAELRLGKDPQQVVRIRRDDGKAAKRRRRAS